MMSIFSSTRRAAVIVSCAVTALSLTLLGSVAQAHTSSGSATSSPRSTHAKADATIDNCPFGYLCLSQSAQGSPGNPGWPDALPNANITGNPYFWPWGQCQPVRFDGCNAGVGSYVNNTGQRVWLEQLKNSGNELCINPGAYVPDNIGTLNQNDFWILLSGNPAAC